MSWPTLGSAIILVMTPSEEKMKQVRALHACLVCMAQLRRNLLHCMSAFYRSWRRVGQRMWSVWRSRGGSRRCFWEAMHGFAAWEPQP